MTVIGFHASHEQVHPSELLAAVQRAEQAAAPYDPIVQAAEHAVTTAQDTHRRAERTLADTGLFGRRSARDSLAVTEQNLTDARLQLATDEEAARPSHQERGTARRALTDARDRLRNEDILERWAYRHERIEHVESIQHALTDWYSWASGQPIAWEQVATATQALDDIEPKADPHRRYAALAHTLHTFAEHHGVDLRPPERAIEPRGLETGF